ncbi:MAG: sporulation protein YunB [Halanaerobiales bacterium]
MKFRFWRVVLGFIILLLILFYCIHRTITPVFFNLAEVRVKNIANQAINQAVAKEVEDINYQDIINYVYNEQGEIVLMQPDIKYINTFTTSMSLAIQKELEKVSREVVKVPLTRILGIDILAAYGPDLDMQIVPAGYTVPPEVCDSFSSAGINQTRHKIYLRVAADFKMIVPFSSKDVEVTAEVPVTEVVILGRVPNVYLGMDKEGLTGIIE